jgi:ABC-type nitrate/sulfonate/bicarbonate transport system substrate-binding protein
MFSDNTHEMLRVRPRLRAAIVAASAVLVSALPASATETRVRVNVFIGPQNIALYVAQEKGFFARRGLAVEIEATPNSRAQRDGLINGRSDIVQSAVDNAVALVEVEKQDVVIVAGGSDGMNQLVVRPEINSYQDIRGHGVAVDRPDTAYALILYKMLALQGLREGDYSVIAAGVCPQRRAALQPGGGGVAAMMNPPCTLMVAKEGYRSFGRATDVIGPYLADGIWVMRAWAQANADTLVRYLQASIEAYRWAAAPGNRAEAAAILAKYLHVDADIAAGSLEAAIGPQGGVAKDARLDMPGFRNTLKLRAEMAGGNPDAQPEKYLDLSYYERALAGL